MRKEREELSLYILLSIHMVFSVLSICLSIHSSDAGSRQCSVPIDPARNNAGLYYDSLSIIRSVSSRRSQRGSM